MTLMKVDDHQRIDGLIGAGIGTNQQNGAQPAAAFEQSRAYSQANAKAPGSTPSQLAAIAPADRGVVRRAEKPRIGRDGLRWDRPPPERGPVSPWGSLGPNRDRADRPD